MKNFPFQAKIKTLSPKKQEIVKFLTVGAFCLVFNTAILYLLIEIAKIQYLIATIIGFFLSNLLGFLLNKYYTFKAFKTNIWRELYKYYSVMGSSFLANLLLMAILVEFFKIWAIYGSFMVAILITTYNYVMHKKWSFKNSKNKISAHRYYSGSDKKLS